MTRGKLGQKSFRGNRIYKGDKDIAKKAIILISLKMHLKSLEILEKASIPVKKSSKIIEIFIKAPRF
jgi:hypothetical protein